MTKEEFVEKYSIEPDAVFIGSDEEWEIYKDAIVGVTEDKCHIVYSYNKIVESLVDSYMKESYDENRDYVTEAMEWIDNNNTIRSIPYLLENYRPIIIYNVEDL